MVCKPPNERFFAQHYRHGSAEHRVDYQRLVLRCFRRLDARAPSPRRGRDIVSNPPVPKAFTTCQNNFSRHSPTTCSRSLSTMVHGLRGFHLRGFHLRGFQSRRAAKERLPLDRVDVLPPKGVPMYSSAKLGRWLASSRSIRRANTQAGLRQGRLDGGRNFCRNKSNRAGRPRDSRRGRGPASTADGQGTLRETEQKDEEMLVISRRGLRLVSEGQRQDSQPSQVHRRPTATPQTRAQGRVHAFR